MYAKNDLRSQMQPAAAQAASPVKTPFKPATYANFYEEKPVEETADAKNWYTRGQNLVVAYSEVKAGATFERKGQVDEYAVMMPEKGMSIEVTHGDEHEAVQGPAVVFIAAGDSTIKATADGVMFRCITVRSADMAAKATNADLYKTDDPNIPPLEAWPDPVDGKKIHAYSGEYPMEQGRFGRIFRGSTIMFNFGNGAVGARDIEKMSPHHHNDFEQYSLVTAGEYVHHLRWPWTPSKPSWREDEHEFCKSPSVAVITPPAIHTSQAMAEGLNRLCDTFCPPRFDFSAKPGWVINADIYPMPGEKTA